MSQKSMLDETMDSLFNSVAWLHRFWNVYHTLFGSSEEKILLMNRRTGRVLGIYQLILWDTILLEIAKLLSRRMQGKEQMSLDRAISQLPMQNEQQLKASGELKSKCDELRDVKHRKIIAHRDQRIAHNDVVTVRNEKLLDNLSRADIQTAIDDIVEMLNAIGHISSNTEYRFDIGLHSEISECELLMGFIELGNAKMDHDHNDRP